MRVDWYAISMLKPITAHEFPGPKGGIYIHRIAAIEPFYQVTIILFGVPCWVEKWLCGADVIWVPILCKYSMACGMKRQEEAGR